MSVFTVKLENMEFRARHGCYDLEKVVGNDFLVTLVVQADCGQAAQRDDVSLAIDYTALYRIVCEEMACPSNILENVAQRILTAVKTRFPEVIQSEVTVSKLAPPMGGKMEKVSVSLSL